MTKTIFNLHMHWQYIELTISTLSPSPGAKGSPKSERSKLTGQEKFAAVRQVISFNDINNT